MIFYFSGTGNSYHAGKIIALAQGERLISIAKECDQNQEFLEYPMQENELLGFVYPVYAWGPPKIVLDFIGRLKLSGGRPYVFSLCTCGDEEGHTTRILRKALKKQGVTLDSAFTIKMPNNYIVGFDVEPNEVQNEKLKQADITLKEINHLLTNRQKGAVQIHEGSVAALKSGVINPLFNRFALKTKWFFATDDCNQCGICEEVCPIHSITIKDKPVWDKGCTQCLACLHRCPVRAIQYGKGTIKKGRYLHPDLK